MTIAVSTLPKTWLIDIDGTLFFHNRYLEGNDCPLPDVMEFFAAIPAADKIILLTARPENARAATLAALAQYSLRYDLILFDLPVGERILINDRKPSGLTTAYAFNVERDAGLGELISQFVVKD